MVERGTELRGIAARFWVFLYFRFASRNDPPGWIVDRATPDAPRLVAMVGVGFVLVSIVWAVARLIRRRAQ